MSIVIRLARFGMFRGLVKSFFVLIRCFLVRGRGRRGGEMEIGGVGIDGMD
jgi:hypothetical protein